jgi:predicted nucleotidyltransferase
MQGKSSNTVRVVFPPFSRDELVAQLRRQVADLAERLPLRRVALFGSWAAGRATVASDVDVLVIYDGPVRADAFLRANQAILVPRLEAHVYAFEEAERIQGTLARMTHGAIELWP